MEPLDPTTSLAINMQSSRGLDALLIGSGVSRSAQIPTGWGIILDLIRKLDPKQTADMLDEPLVQWYVQKFKREPNYSDLVGRIAKTPAARLALLNGYFERTEEDEAGAKEPQAAHHAIADLVASGCVQMIITTNFDRLIEKALAGRVEPLILYTPELMQGAFPPPSNDQRPIIVKLHGDYRHPETLNTDEELRRYQRPAQRLLKRVSDEYGLVICGWSGEWDQALKGELQRNLRGRYPWYWVSPGGLSEGATNLLNIRSGTYIPVAADEFFPDLAGKVTDLTTMAEAAHPMTIALAVARTKKYLSEPRYEIQLADLIASEAKRAYESLWKLNAEPTNTGSPDEVLRRLRGIEQIIEPFGQMLFTIGYSGTAEALESVIRSIEHLGSKPGSVSSVKHAFLVYPSLLAVYALGTGLSARRHFETLKRALENAVIPKGESGETDTVIHHGVSNSTISVFTACSTLENVKLPLNERLYVVLREWLKDAIPVQRQYDAAFDDLELIISIIFNCAGRWMYCFDGGTRPTQGSFADRIFGRLDSGGAEIFSFLKKAFATGTLDELPPIFGAKLQPTLADLYKKHVTQMGG